MSGRHMTEDEVVNRVFPTEEGPAPIPIHQAVCPECQQRVAKLREAFLLDRGAVTGFVESLSAEVWTTQRRAIMRRVTELAAVEAEERATPFPARFTRSILHRPVFAIGSLAAALALVAGLTFFRSGPDAGASPGATVAVAQTNGAGGLTPADRADDELLRSVDSILSTEAPYGSLLPEAIR